VLHAATPAVLLAAGLAAGRKLLLVCINTGLALLHAAAPAGLQARQLLGSRLAAELLTLTICISAGLPLHPPARLFASRLAGWLLILCVPVSTGLAALHAAAPARLRPCGLACRRCVVFAACVSAGATVLHAAAPAGVLAGLGFCGVLTLAVCISTGLALHAGAPAGVLACAGLSRRVLSWLVLSLVLLLFRLGGMLCLAVVLLLLLCV
jgi:hypothetical protein